MFHLGHRIAQLIGSLLKMGLELGWDFGKQKYQMEQFLFVLVTLNISKNMVKLQNSFWIMDTHLFNWIGEDMV